jgi:hypothetical protein
MARRKDDRHRAGSAEARDVSLAADELTAGGPRDFVLEEERLSDGRYILYYGWAAPRPAAPPRKARPERRTGR